MLNGSDGIPLDGRAEAYATELWLDDPSAFWLHPEGPLSDTTPAEYLAKREDEERRTQAAIAQNPYANAYAQMAWAQNALGQSAYMGNRGLVNQSPFASLFGQAFGL